MLAQVFKIDVTKCDACGSDRVAVCSVMERTSVQRYLRHLGLDLDPPARAPPRSTTVSNQREFDFASSAQSFWGALSLTAITDNAALTYLGTLVPNLSISEKYALVAGAVAGGG